MLTQESQPVYRTGFSLRSVLLIALIVSLGAGATAFAIGHGLSGITTTTSSPSQQSTTTTTASTASTGHECNQTATG